MPLTPEQHALADAMSAISEDLWFAGWMGGNEYQLWAETLSTFERRSAGFPVRHLNPEEVANLKALSEACGGWIVWDDRNGCLPRPDGTWEEDGGYRFVPLDQWKSQFAKENE